MALIKCSECGKEISDKASACPHCGCPVATPPVLSQEEQDRQEQTARLQAEERQAAKKKQITALVVAILAILVCAVVVVFFVMSKSPKHNFHNLKYLQYIEDNDGCKLSEDGKTMVLDSNPDDVEGYDNSAILGSIKVFNEQLGIPDSVLEKMYATRALDGRQTETYGRITISWTYHPNSGLEVIYEIK